MIEIDKPKIEIVDVSTVGSRSTGRFVVEPLERGFGSTLGNGMRRVLLSSLPGYAITSVKIDGVLHEFSTIPHVKEDVTEIIMNIKNLAIRNNSSTNEPKVAYIEFEGEGVVTAADIQVDSDIEIMNPELEIAHLNGGADCKLYMELTITKGRGYVSADKNKTEDTPIGVIAIDSIYTPVDRVNVTIENTRVGQVTDYDKLTLDVYTNGTLEPDEAVSLAAKVLSEHLNLFIDLSDAAQQAEHIALCRRQDDLGPARLAGFCPGRVEAVRKKTVTTGDQDMPVTVQQRHEPAGIKGHLPEFFPRVLQQLRLGPDSHLFQRVQGDLGDQDLP